MQPPSHLPGQLFLLAYHERHRRLVPPSQIQLIMRAAALEDLRLSGAVAEESGKVTVVTHHRLADPVLDAILRELSEGKPRTWHRLLTLNGRRTVAAVREQLEDSLHIRLEPHRVLGLFPATRMYPRDMRVIHTLRERVRHTLAVVRPTAPAEPHDAALIAIASAGQLNTAVTKADQRQYAERIKALTAQAGVVPATLRKVLQEQAASSAGG